MMTNPSESEVPAGIEAQREPMQRVGQLVYNMLPNDCEKIEFTARMLSTRGEWTVLVYRGGSPFTYSDFDPKTIEEFVPLRVAMYKPGAGTWYTAVVTVTNEGSADFRYDYNNEPAWTNPIGPDYYARDQEHFPRLPEHQPEWLIARLAEVAA
jgi:hypothetical protein